jgi:hypothetical protein
VRIDPRIGDGETGLPLPQLPQQLSLRDACITAKIEGRMTVRSSKFDLADSSWRLRESDGEGNLDVAPPELHLD